MLEVQQWGALWTTSMSNGENPQLWNLLAYNCSIDSWRSAINEYGIIASCSTMIVKDSNKIVHKQILSCAVDATEDSLNDDFSEGIIFNYINI
jgi:hypothetical protein